MPTLRIMVWNLQNFGDAVPAKGNYVPLCNFIAYIVAQQQIDVFVMEELRQAGVAYLGQLRDAMNTATAAAHGDWRYDYVKGALSVDPAVNLPVNAGNTQMDTDHHEGYALFWNHARNNVFTIAATPENISLAGAVTLVYRGRNSAGGIANNGWFNAPNFTPGAPNANNVLNFCRSAARIHVGDQLAVGPRRPCSFAVNLDPGNNQNNPARYLLPVTVYHATANQRNTATNVQLSGYTRQLYQVYNPASNSWGNAENGIIAGDFNINAFVDNTNRQAYRVYAEAYNNGGANALPGYTTLNNFGNSPPTTVQIRDLHTLELIKGDEPDDFLKLAIDHFFYRMPNGQPATNCTGWVVDLFGMLMRSWNYPGLQNIIQSFMNPINAALGARQFPADTYANYPYREADSNTPARSADGSQPVVGSLWNWENFRFGIMGSSFDEVNGRDNGGDACAAAEFINKLVSDHLPTGFRFDF